jgi:predicted permease
MRSFLQDLRYGLRILARQPGFAIVATLVLGLGIGANTTMFRLVDALALKPRLGDTERLVSLYSKNRQEAGNFRAFSYPNYVDLREQHEPFATLSAHVPTLVGISEGTETRRAFIDIVTADFFATFGVMPALGRPFTVEEERPHADIPVTVLSDSAWRHLGAPPDILGKTIRINQRDFTVVGVVPRGFGGTMAVVTPELWLPLGVYDTISSDFVREGLPGTLADRTHHALYLVGRLRDGLAGTAADAAVDAAGQRLENAFPIENKDQSLLVRPVSRLSISTSPEGGKPLAVLSTVLMSMAGVVLLIACLNLANMQLARGAARRKEFAIRASIGGGRLRATRQLLTEGLAMSLPGALLALGISWASMRLLNVAVAGRLPIQLSIDPSPDWRIFGAALGFAVLAAVMFGLGPALALARADLLTGLKEQTGEVPVTRSRFAARHLLVMGQLALSLALLTAGGLFVRGASVASHLDPGFTFDRGVIVQTDASLASYDKSRALDIYARALDRLRELPGVTAVAFGSLMPFGEITEANTVQKPGPRRREVRGQRSSGVGISNDGSVVDGVASAVSYSISAGFFPALGLTLRRGRDFTVSEVFHGGPPVAIVDEALARRIFGEEDAIGRQLQINGRGDDVAPEIVEVVGIAPPILHQMNDRSPGPQIYRPLAQDFRSGVTFHLTTNAASAQAEGLMLPGVRQLLRAVDDRLPVVTLETRPMFRERNLMLWIVRAGAWVFTAFGLVALGMAALGIYGVKAYLVSRRTREIGIRMALGANPRQVVRLVMSDGMGLTLGGLVIGLALSAVMSPAVGSLLFQGSGFDAPVVVAAFITLLMAASLASWLPARRATRIAPSAAVRDL